MISTIIYACKARKSNFLYLLYYPLYSIDTVTERSETPTISTRKFHAHEIAEEKEHQRRKLFRMLPDEVIKTILDKCKSLHHK